MDAIKILLIILLDFSAFFLGFIIGLTVKEKRQEYIKRSKSVVKNSDLLSLLYYTPGEPTDNLLKNIKENDNGRKYRNHTR